MNSIARQFHRISFFFFFPKVSFSNKCVHSTWYSRCLNATVTQTTIKSTLDWRLCSFSNKSTKKSFFIYLLWLHHYILNWLVHRIEQHSSRLGDSSEYRKEKKKFLSCSISNSLCWFCYFGTKSLFSFLHTNCWQRATKIKCCTFTFAKSTKLFVQLFFVFVKQFEFINISVFRK